MMEEREHYSGLDNLNVMGAAKNYNDSIVSLILKHRPPLEHCSILDFGAGIGAFADLLGERSQTVDCLEPDRQMAGLLRSKGYCVFMDAQDIPQRQYDYIYTLNVLEHIKDDRQALLTLSQKLKPDGLMLIYVPAFQALYSSMDAKVGHHRRYTRRGLERLVTGAGMHVLETGYADSIGFFASIAYKLFGGKNGEISATQVALFDKRIFPLNRFLDPWVGRALGKNVFCVCNRP